jgi:DNA-directed RNA polymerase specialized sigma24 family protein
MVIIIRKLGSLQDPQVFRPWTFRIASREAFRHLKKRRAWMEKHEDDFHFDNLPSPEIRPSGEELLELLAIGESLQPAAPC